MFTHCELQSTEFATVVRLSIFCALRCMHFDTICSVRSFRAPGTMPRVLSVWQWFVAGALHRLCSSAQLIACATVLRDGILPMELVFMPALCMLSTLR